MTDKPAKPEKEIIYVVCTGTSVGEDNKPGICLTVVSKEQLDTGVLIGGEKTIFFSLNKRTKRLDGVGNVYALPRDAGKEGSYYVGMATWEQQWKGRDDRVRWAADQRAVEAALAVEKKIKTARADDPIKEACEPLRKAYINSVGANRSQLLAYIVSCITQR